MTEKTDGLMVKPANSETTQNDEDRPTETMDTEHNIDRLNNIIGEVIDSGAEDLKARQFARICQTSLVGQQQTEKADLEEDLDLMQEDDEDDGEEKRHLLLSCEQNGHQDAQLVADDDRTDDSAVVLLTGKQHDDEEEEYNLTVDDSDQISKTLEASSRDDELYEKPRRNHRWYHINMGILPAKWCYFFDCGRKASTNANMILFLTQIGLDKGEAGLILGFSFVGALLAGPFWGVLADRYHIHRTIIVLTNILSCITMASQPFISLKYGNPNTNRCPYNSNTELIATTNLSSLASNNTYITPNPSNQDDNGGGSYNYEPYGSLFYTMLLMQLATSFFNGSSTSFTDIAVMRKSQLAVTRQKHNRPINYGRQRFVGAFGVMSCVAVMNYSFDVFPRARVTCYTSIFPIYILLTVLFIISALFLYKGLSFTDTDHQEQQSEVKKETYNKTLRKTLTQFDMLIFYLTVFIVGYINAPFFLFLFVRLKELDAATAVFTLSFVISAATALFGFFFSSQIIRALGGPLRTMLSTIFVYAIRGFAVAMVPNAWLVLPFQCLHFVSFVLFVAACIEHLRKSTPLVVMSTLVSLFRSIFEALANIVSSTTGGMVMKEYGSRQMFMFYGCIAAAWGILFGVYVFKKECTTIAVKTTTTKKELFEEDGDKENANYAL